jgi:hypothetical protein
MNETIDRLTLPLVRVSAALLLGVTWIIPAWNKLSAGGVPGGFAERFSTTFLASFPGIPASYYSIAILEAIAGLLAVGSLLTGEFLPGKKAPLIKAAVILSTLVFIQLGFGLRLTGDNDGAANLFTYTIGAFVLLLSLNWFEQRQASESKN